MTSKDKGEMERIVAAALAEDLGETGDATSQRLLSRGQAGSLQFNARQEMVAAGLFIPGMVFAALGGSVSVGELVTDGERVTAGTALVQLSGPAQVLLTGERVALNLMQRACAVATVTRRFVDAVAGTGATILDTRKTMPGLRELDKYAVRCGGGVNHRMGLYDAVMIKDNHIAMAGGMAAAMEKARAGAPLPVIVECDTLEQVEMAMAAKPDRILLDNMPPEMLKKAVAMVAGKVPLEASGGITLATVRAVAETGIQFISVGAMTHSAPSVDIGADVTLG